MSNAAAKARSAQIVDRGAAAELKALVDAMPDPKKVTGARLKRYSEATGAETHSYRHKPADLSGSC